MAAKDVSPTARGRQTVRSILDPLTGEHHDPVPGAAGGATDPTMLPSPIATAPRPDREPVPILLYCPKRGCWETGLWWQGAWRLQGDLACVVTPTHWIPASREVVVENCREGRVTRRKL